MCPLIPFHLVLASERIATRDVIRGSIQAIEFLLPDCNFSTDLLNMTGIGAYIFFRCVQKFLASLDAHVVKECFRVKIRWH